MSKSNHTEAQMIGAIKQVNIPPKGTDRSVPIKNSTKGTVSSVPFVILRAAAPFSKLHRRHRL